MGAEAEAVEVIAGRLYWEARSSEPEASDNVHYFSVDQELLYKPLNHDFGPLSLSMVYRYLELLDAKLKDASLLNARIVHYCSTEFGKRANAAFLICAYQVVFLLRSPQEAFKSFSRLDKPFLPFCDASTEESTYDCTILDCLQGLEYALKLGWFRSLRTNLEWTEYYERVEHGDLNWIVPGRMLAFAGPCPSRAQEGWIAHTPAHYVDIFRKVRVGLVVRLNRPQYEASEFTDKGIKHADLYFPDGTCPSQEIIDRFLRLVEAEPPDSGIAVHCTAGLGRTATLIGLYAMKHFRFPARALIGWCKICRPGSLLCEQPQFLCELQLSMFQARARMRMALNPDSSGVNAARSEQLLSATTIGGLEVRRLDGADSPKTLPPTPSEALSESPPDGRSLGQRAEDVGQGEMLLERKWRNSDQSPALVQSVDQVSPRTPPRGPGAEMEGTPPVVVRSMAPSESPSPLADIRTGRFHECDTALALARRALQDPERAAEERVALACHALYMQLHSLQLLVDPRAAATSSLRLGPLDDGGSPKTRCPTAWSLETTPDCAVLAEY